MPQNRYPRIWQTEPHGEHSVTLVADHPDYRQRIYNLNQKLSTGNGTKTITMLGSEIESLGAWMQGTESKRASGMIPLPPGMCAPAGKEA